MKIYLASDHAGYTMKEQLVLWLRDIRGAEVEDCGAHTHDVNDDYPEIIADAIAKLSNDCVYGAPLNRAIILGGSGQGEAIVANRFPHIRAGVFYGYPQSMQQDQSGETMDIISSLRIHNDCNVLSLGARFITFDEAQQAVSVWLDTQFTGNERHSRRIEQIEQIEKVVS